ncbi:Tryptophan synthase alpha chain [Labilithrix luteola]|uniref:Tryptophan synthase alpha chain n=1 Tax=Labilithrix luteola TaxID=1391654 RepID=A0A0K1PNV7_9BACT|nr:Tryptophan synthase alpha chain [Labilithrix luteola]
MRLHASTFVAVSFVALIACQKQTVEFVPPSADAGLSFTNPDDGGAAIGVPEASLTSYCASYTCTGPFTTCPTSHFPCDVNVMTDPKNCGGCGIECPSMNTEGAYLDCVAGKCVPSCLEGYADCNGVREDLCETRLGDNDNCNGCGDACPDPAKPCIYDDDAKKGQCGCDKGRSFCAGACVDLETSDDNCGACGVACPRTGASEPGSNAHYGCDEGTCGHVKCDQGFANCDGKNDNGCEANLLSPTSCGACNIACDPGQTCRRNSKGEAECICAKGQTLCGDTCADLRADLRNCGGCGIDCTSIALNANGLGTCTYGSCGFVCMQDWGECNGDPTDGCEVNLASDPRNCGACGNECDVLSGQPCIAGKCAVEPCRDGEVPQ